MVLVGTFCMNTEEECPNTLDGNPDPKHRALAGHHAALWASEIDKSWKPKRRRGFLYRCTVLKNEMLVHLQ